MKRRKKTITLELEHEDWWSLNRFAARENKSLRGLSMDQLKPVLAIAKKMFPYHSEIGPDPKPAEQPKVH